MGMITNGGVLMQGGKISHLGLAPAFDTILISGAEGVKKPDPQIFLRAVARLGVDPAEAVHVGDNPVADVGGAKTAGLRAIWRRDGPDAEMPEADAVIDQIGEVLEIVRGWWMEPLPRPS